MFIVQGGRRSAWETWQALSVAQLYRGACPAILGTGINWMIYSHLYEELLNRVPMWMAVVGGRTVVTDLVAGCVCGIVTCWCVNPLWVLKVRLLEDGGGGGGGGGGVCEENRRLGKTGHTPHTASMVEATLRIVRQEGVLTLWSGVVPSMFGCLEGALQFLIVEAAKRNAATLGGESFSFVHLLWVGAVARSVAVIVCYPYQSIRSMQQSKAGFVWKRDGTVTTLYAGLSTKVVREFLTGGIFTCVRESLLK